jgi:hypothetical protein
MDVSTVKKPPTQPVQAAKRPEQARNLQSYESKSKAPEVKKTSEAKPSPVVNTQGHTTGRLLNVTA